MPKKFYKEYSKTITRHRQAKRLNSSSRYNSKKSSRLNIFRNIAIIGNQGKARRRLRRKTYPKSALEISNDRLGNKINQMLVENHYLKLEMARFNHEYEALHQQAYNYSLQKEQEMDNLKSIIETEVKINFKIYLNSFIVIKI